ncbi:MAG: Mrp/NBP35 family ATP-binding protein [Myxococcales bacterium]|nr:Mrp/NBP35 family ATP-binding protein [Myxococcales bacterium]
MNEDQIKALLSEVPAPGGEGDIVSAGIVGEVEVDGGEVVVVLRFEGIDRDARHALEDQVRTRLGNTPGVEELFLEVEVPDLPEPKAPPAGVTFGGGAGPAAAAAPKPKGALSGVTHLIAVASGKGGVGKSTVAVNLALALANRGASVGLCDIDIYGPSVPIQLGVAGAKPGVSADQKRFLPVDAYGLKVMSIGFLVDDDTPVIWRGPIVSSVVKQFLEDVEWGTLDYLVIDMPPGTGDAQLTLSQSAPLTGAVIVTTPSELALVDAVKGLQMFRKVDTPVLGLVENMSHYACPSCGHESHPFNIGGTERVAEQFGVGVLARVPIEIDIQRGGDTGKPMVAANPEAPQSAAFLELADAVIGKCPFQKGDAGKKKGFLANIFKR